MTTADLGNDTDNNSQVPLPPPPPPPPTKTSRVDSSKNKKNPCAGCLGGDLFLNGVISDAWKMPPSGTCPVPIQEVPQCVSPQDSVACFSSLLNASLYSGANQAIYSTSDHCTIRSSSSRPRRVVSSLDTNGTWSKLRGPDRSRVLVPAIKNISSFQTNAPPETSPDRRKELLAMSSGRTYLEGDPKDVLFKLSQRPIREEVPSGYLCGVPNVCGCRRPSSPFGSSSSSTTRDSSLSLQEAAVQVSACQSQPSAARHALAAALPDGSPLRTILLESQSRSLDDDLFASILGVIIHGDPVPPTEGLVAGYQGPVRAFKKNTHLVTYDDSVSKLQNMNGYRFDHLSSAVFEAVNVPALLNNSHYPSDLWLGIGAGNMSILPGLYDVHPQIAHAWGDDVSRLVWPWVVRHYQSRAGGANTADVAHDYIVLQDLRNTIAVRQSQVSVTYKSSFAECGFPEVCWTRGLDAGVLLQRPDIMDWAPSQRAALWIACISTMWHDAIDYGRDMVNCEQGNIVWVALSKFGEEAGDVLLSMFTAVAASCREVCVESDVYLVIMWFMVVHSSICRRYNGWQVVQETYPRVNAVMEESNSTKPYTPKAEDLCRQIARDFKLDEDMIWNKVVALSDNKDELERLWFGNHRAWSGPNCVASAEESAAMYSMIARDCLDPERYRYIAGHVIGGAMTAKPIVFLRACIEAIECENAGPAQHDAWE
ncbi:hypothetical protein BG004_007462 [Podila humilis]|nr:hypothetical protein BG004_007462 [Podila humilis]